MHFTNRILEVEMENRSDQRRMKTQTLGVFIVILFIMLAAFYWINYNQEKREKLKAVSTAELTVSRVESQLNKYLTESDLLKRIVESGNEMDDTEFAELSHLMLQDNQVIEAFEMAKDGVVS